MSSRLQRLGKYTVVKELARGANGIVYLARDPFIARDVAIKVALPDAGHQRGVNSRTRRAFFAEAQAAGGLRHPNILQVYDAGVDEDLYYIVMEYIQEGMTLRPYCVPKTLLPLSEVTRIAFMCARALDYAHRQGVVHLDIKPSNLLLTEEGEAKIADFGVARVQRDDIGGSFKIGFAGSPGYMSPEQIQGDPITMQTDLFSLGVVMYEALTGRHPFFGKVFSRVIDRIVNENPLPMRRYRRGIPEALERIVRRALEKDLRVRYKSGLDLAADLAAAFPHLGQPQDDIVIQERVGEARHLDIFKELDEAEVWELMRSATFLRHRTGQRIVNEGDLDDGFYILLEGRVGVTRGERTVGVLERGDCFGEMGYLSSSHRTVSIVALSDASFIKINAALMDQLSKDCQLHFCKAFLKRLIERLALTLRPYETAR
ncbi:MAG: protein kinase domain-containing protein [Gammaproteobacteria bacterium]